MNIARLGSRWLATLALSGVVLYASELRAQFIVNPITAPVEIPFTFDSSAEVTPDPNYVLDPGSLITLASPTGVGYLSNLQATRVLLANPNVRSIRLLGVDNSMFIGPTSPRLTPYYWLGPDECIESAVAPRPGISSPWPCTPRPVEDRDHLSVAWDVPSAPGLDVEPTVGCCTPAEDLLFVRPSSDLAFLGGFVLDPIGFPSGRLGVGVPADGETLIYRRSIECRGTLIDISSWCSLP